MSVLFVVGCLVAFLACAFAYRQELREQVQPESPVVITGLMFLLSLVVFAGTLSANTQVDPCSTVEKGSLLWWLGHCYWG